MRMWFRNRAPRAEQVELEARFAAMKQFPDPMSYYLSLMHVAAGQVRGSGLGLARVWAEAGMTLSLEVESDRVTIWAEAQTTAP